MAVRFIRAAGTPSKPVANSIHKCAIMKTGTAPAVRSSSTLTSKGVLTEGTNEMHLKRYFLFVEYWNSGTME
jgi:hypothetical protein